MPYWRSFVSSGIDSTVSNAVCLECHAENSTHPRKGPPQLLHAGSTTSEYHGLWSTECTQCHDAHSQGQLDWYGNDGLYLAWGTLTSVGTYLAKDPDGSPDYGSTKFSINGVASQAGWGETATWVSKGGKVDKTKATDGSRGLVFVPNILNHSESYEIISASPTHVKVKGKVATAGLSGKTFGVIYGQAIKSFLMPNGGSAVNDYRDVKFFSPETFAGFSGGPIDDSAVTIPQGICQVCHSQTAHWKQNGSGNAHQIISQGSSCLTCHQHSAGFSSPPVQQSAMISLTADLITAAPGETVLISWVTQFAYDDTIDIVDEYGNLIVSRGPTSGSISIPVDNYGFNKVVTFTATAEGGTGASMPSILEITILDYSVPVIEFTAEPSWIERGGQSTLSWSVTGADSVTISPVGQAETTGSQTVTPLGTTAYILTATNPGHTVFAETKVSVLPPLPTLSVSADQAAILAGQTTRVYWSSTDADVASWRELNGVGTWGPWFTSLSNDYLEVAPDVTTTYQIKVTNVVGSASGMVTVKVLASETIGIAITSPENNATVTVPTARIEGLAFDPNQQFSVMVNGISASQFGNYFSANDVPLQAGANTITAMVFGPDRTMAMDSIVINAALPIDPIPEPLSVTITNPMNEANISKPFVTVEGELTDSTGGVWISVNNITAQVSGDRFFLTNLLLANGENTITAIAHGQNGTTAQSSIVVSANFPVDPSPQGFAILKPMVGMSFTEPFVQVEGQLAEGTGEVGVTVNGVPAQVIGNKFFVNNLPLVEGDNTITAVATYTNGDAEETSVIVAATTPGYKWVELSLNPESGVASPYTTPPMPFITTLQVTPHLNNTVVISDELTWEYSGSATGSAQISIIAVNAEGTEHQLSFNQPGVYTLHYTLYDSNLAAHRAEIKVNVLDSGEVDGLLKAKWNNVKAAWTGQDVEGGLTYFAESSKTNYRYALTALVAELPQIVGEMQDIELIYARDRYVKYRINRLQDINGAVVNMTYYLYFVKDQSGLWKVDQF